MDNAGNFMLGDQGGALKAAMGARGVGAGVTNQSTLNGVLPSSPPPTPSGGAAPMPQGQPSDGQTVLPPTTANASAPGAGGNPEAQKILSSMDSYLKSISKISEAQAGIQ